MKTIAFSTIHIQDAEHGASIAGELADWRDRLAWAFDDAPAIFLCESGPVNDSPAGFKTVWFYNPASVQAKALIDDIQIY